MGYDPKKPTELNKYIYDISKMDNARNTVAPPGNGEKNLNL